MIQDQSISMCDVHIRKVLQETNGLFMGQYPLKYCIKKREKKDLIMIIMIDTAHTWIEKTMRWASHQLRPVTVSLEGSEPPDPAQTITLIIKEIFKPHFKGRVSTKNN